MNIFNANLEVTKATVQGGEIKDLEINRQNVPLASSVKIETSKAVTIDVSEYTEPIEITPTAGKDGMAKATVTLSNIPEAEASAYAWQSADDSSYVYTNFAVAPDNLTGAKILASYSDGHFDIINFANFEYSKTSDTSYVFDDITYNRVSAKDITLW